jgi:Glycosyltransferases involved in cell wall biogenesis
MQPKVSILVPVYNVSNFIEKCAHSLFQQTFNDIEYIFVDDCTPDDSIEKLQKIAQEYPERQNRVKIVYHKKNKGSAAARNTAIENSTGKYILFIDSDDWIENNMVELMYKKAETEKADIVTCDMLIEKTNETEVCAVSLGENENDVFLDLFAAKASNVSLSNKMILRKLYTMPENKVPDGLNVFEDRYLMFRLAFCANKIVRIPQTFYHYIKTNPNSLTKQTSIHLENFLLYLKTLETFFKEKNIYDKYINQIEYSKVAGKVGFMTNTRSYKMRKQYAGLFRDIEMKYISRFRVGEKLILFFTHYKMYVLAQLVHRIIWMKNK